MPTGGDGTAYMGEAAVSQQQQKFMGMVYAYKKGEMPNASDEVKKAAEGMTMKEVEKYASTKHAKLPKKIEEKLDKNDVPVIKGIIDKLEGASKKHKNQSIALKKAVEEINYFVPRFYSSLPNLNKKSDDLDLVVDKKDFDKLIQFLNANPGEIAVDVYTDTGLDFHGISYFPPYLAKEILKRSVEGPAN